VYAYCLTEHKKCHSFVTNEKETSVCVHDALITYQRPANEKADLSRQCREAVGSQGSAEVKNHGESDEALLLSKRSRIPFYCLLKHGAKSPAHTKPNFWKLNPWSTNFLEQLVVAQLVNKFPAFMEPEGS
jgi:hypothetical protein